MRLESLYSTKKKGGHIRLKVNSVIIYYRFDLINLD